MIELEVNGHRQVVDPSTTGELRDLMQRELPSGHVIRRIDVDGDQVDEGRLEDLQLERLHSVAVRSCTAQEIARESVGETAEWIGRICGVLESIATDFRLGRENEATGRLVDVVDALQVLVALLGGINGFIKVDPVTNPDFESDWAAAEKELCGSIEGLFAELQGGDPHLLADRTGHLLPSALRAFCSVLERIST